MNIAAAFDVDRQYYATFYCMWLKHRSRWRWIRERLKTQFREKHVDLIFNDDDVAIKTPNSIGTMRYTAFTNVTIAQDGIFLVPDTGVSIFVPRTAFNSDHDFQRVAETVRDKHASTQCCPPCTLT